MSLEIYNIDMGVYNLCILANSKAITNIIDLGRFKVQPHPFVECRAAHETAEHCGCPKERKEGVATGNTDGGTPMTGGTAHPISVISRGRTLL